MRNNKHQLGQHLVYQQQDAVVEQDLVVEQQHPWVDLDQWTAHWSGSGEEAPWRMQSPRRTTTIYVI